MVSDKIIYRAFRTHVTLDTKLIREFFHFLYLPKLYIGFNPFQFFLCKLSEQSPLWKYMREIWQKNCCEIGPIE